MQRMDISHVVRTVVLAAMVAGLVVLGRTGAAAQNLVTNPGFDGDLSGWMTGPGVTFDATLDDTGTPGSGSARAVPVLGEPPQASFTQCLPATAGATYVWGGKYFSSSEVGIVDLSVTLFFASAPDCNPGSILAFGGGIPAFGNSTDTWELLSSTDGFPDGVVAPDGTASIFLLVGAGATVNFDDLFVMQEGEEPVPGSITVVKQTIGGDGVFTFTSNLPANADFSISTTGGSGQLDPIPVDPGTYSIVEPESDAWTLISATCDNGDDPAEVTVGEEESVTCTFVNEAMEVVPALPWLATIALMLLIASSAVWALRRARA